MKEIFNKLNKTHYISFIFFILGYLFALSNSDKNLIEILKHFSPLYFAISNILYFLLIIFVVRTLIKKYKYYEYNDNYDNLKKVLIMLKLTLIGYFVGSLTILGNSFISVLFLNILS